MGLEAFALSRYAGCCVGLKIIVIQPMPMSFLISVQSGHC